jgi:uncharacterized membrane protein YjfL (UPF0719 family)
MNLIHQHSMIQDIILNLALAIVKIIVAIVLSASAAYAGIGLLDKITSQIDEWKEIKKGNVAVGILCAGLIISLMLLVEPQIADLVVTIQLGIGLPSLVVLLLFGFANYLLSLLLATVVIYLSIHIIDKITDDLEELKELKQGNAAVAIIMAVIMVAIAFALRAPFESIFETIKATELLFV